MSLNRLILVTGFYKTGNWEAAALSSSSSEGNFDFNIGAMASGNGGLSFDWSSVHHLSPNHSTGHCHRRSPASEPLLTSTSPPPTESDTTQVASIAIQMMLIHLPPASSKNICAARNQCIFLRGFRIRERLVLKDQIEALVVPEESTPSWPERLRRLFRSGNTQTSGSSSGAKRAPSAPAPLESIEGSPGPDLCDKLYDEIANEKFMLKNDMDVVVVHDDELIQSLEKNLEGPPKDIDLGFALGGRGFTPSILSKQPEQHAAGVHGDSDAKGGTGGYGAGLVLEEPVVYIDDTAKTLLKPLDTTAFCQKYHLGDEICKLLTNEGYETVNALFEENENEWENLQLKTGHIAELKWAMKKMLLLEYPEIELVDKNGEYAPEIYGWTGGHGTAKAPQIALEDVFRFRRIGGGIGGAGGANGVKKPNVVAIGVNTNPTPQRIVIGTSEPPEVVVAGEATPKTRPNVIGGRGGAGGPGVALGGTGGVGGAAKVPILYVAFFKRISGGIGGAGGYAVKQGGDGGDGEANIFSNLIYSIDKETRRRMPHMPLEELEISANLRGRLKNHGFRTVGGLFEAYEQDLQPPDFKRGHIVLQADFIWSFKHI
ncbi:hypothetical protein B0H14DRAFT_2557788 [Mycena olivaceomarginata]|nr:hypothetical protein B0H14DRAFT_2557788 [Mycena olivaceomarginata]